MPIANQPHRDHQHPFTAEKIAVIIPAYRAAGTIAQVIQAVPDFVQWIVVVDDCSPDNTAEVVSALSNPRAHLVRHAANQGVGGAMLTGYQIAVELGADVLVKIDSDGQMDPKYLPDLIAPILEGRADYAKGNRFLHYRSLQLMPRKRQVGNIGLSLLSKVASGYWNIFDPTNGYTALHKTVFQLLDPSHIDRRYFFETSLLIELGLIRAVVTDVYIPAIYQGENSSLSELHSLVNFPLKLLRGTFRRLVVQYFITDFNAFSIFSMVGVVSLVFGLVFGVFNWYRSYLTNVPTNTGTVMIAIVPVILAVQFLLQALLLEIANVPKNPINVVKKNNRSA